MRFVGYYAWHTFINQIKKLFKSWVIIFILACALIGGLIGVGAGMLTELAEERKETAEEELIEEEISEEEFSEEEFFEDVSLEDEIGISKNELIELIVGGVALLVMVLMILGSEKSGHRTFLPADVNILFPSPLRPQTVLMFRLLTQIGLSIVAGIYMLFQLPNLTLNAGLSIWAALSIVGAYIIATIVGKLLQMLLYLLSSKYESKNIVRYLGYGLVLLVAVLFGASFMREGRYLKAASNVFNAPVSRYVPFWGWIKGFVMSAVEGNVPGVILFFALNVIGIIALVYIIYGMKVDFYEDAMAGSQEIAEAMEAARSSSNGIAFVKRKKDRSDKLLRDGMTKGWGANVFFHKTMYNRKRFAKYGIFTKTSATYLMISLAVSTLCNLVLKTNGLVALMIALGVMVFYRSLGNSYDDDIKMSQFVLIPDKTWKKLLYSLLGNNVNTLLDLLPAVVYAVLLMPGDIADKAPKALFWLIFLVSIDFYATVVGAFIGLSTPQNSGMTIKQILGVMFLYFGLLPCAAFIAVGLALGKMWIGLLIGTLINIVLGVIFFIFCPRFIEPKSESAHQTYNIPGKTV